MIKKWIKYLREKIFGKKEEPIILENEMETPVIEKIICSTHKTRFKKSCAVCRAAGKW
jgi:hypothetical protein